MHYIYLSIKPKPIFLLPQNIITLKLYHHQQNKLQRYIKQDSMNQQKEKIQNKNVKYHRFQFKSYDMALSLREVLYSKIIEFDNHPRDYQFQKAEIKEFLVKVLKENENQVEYFVKNVFRYDKNNDGVIEYDELVNFCMEQHLGEVALQRLHRQKTYAKGSQRLMSEKEFIVTINFALSFIEFFPNEKELSQLFLSIDLDRDGYISYQEYFRFLKQYLGTNSYASKLVNRSTVQEQLKSGPNGLSKQGSLLKKYSKYENNNLKGSLEDGSNGIRKSLVTEINKNEGNGIGLSNANGNQLRGRGMSHNNNGSERTNNTNINMNPNINTNFNTGINPNTIMNLNINTNTNSNLNSNTNNNISKSSNMINNTPNPLKNIINNKSQLKNQPNANNNPSPNNQTINKVHPNNHIPPNNTNNSSNTISYYDNQQYVNNTTNLKRFTLTQKEISILTKIARLVISQIRVFVITLDSDKDLMLSFQQICQIFRTLLKIDDLQHIQSIRNIQKQKTMFYTYDEVIKIVMIEQINIVFKGFNLVASNKEICKEKFIIILQKICEIVKSTPIIEKFSEMYRLRMQKINYGAITAQELLAYSNFIFSHYLEPK